MDAEETNPEERNFHETHPEGTGKVKIFDESKGEVKDEEIKRSV